MGHLIGEVRRLLNIGREITHDYELMYVGNNSLSPNHFDLRNQDREPINGFIYPGKSLHIGFTYDLSVACGALFDRKEPKRQDHLYVVNASSLRDIGFHPFYIPTPNQPLHVRLVHNIHLEDPNIWDTPFQAKKQLATLMSRNKIA